MPLDTSVKAEKKETMEFTPLPKGIYNLELIDIESVEKDKYQKPGEKETVFQFTFGVVNEGELRARRVWENFCPNYLYISSKHGKNKLYQIVEALQKAELSQQQEAEGLNGAFLNTLIGGQVQVATGIKTKGDKTYQTVESWLPAQTSMTALTEDEKKIEKKEVKEEAETMPSSDPNRETPPAPSEDAINVPL